MVVTLAYVPLAAKTHGRLIRLERQLRGFDEIDFRAQNPPFVEALWRRDRIRFWITFALLATAGAILGFVLQGRWSELGMFDAVPLWVGYAFLAFLWPFIATFLIAGGLSAARFRHALRRPLDEAGPGGDRSRDAAWLEGNRRRSAAWWMADLGVAGLLVTLAFL